MDDREVTCLRCGSIEIDCGCADGFCANPYEYITELQAQNKMLDDYATTLCGTRPDEIHENCDRRIAELEALVAIFIQVCPDNHTYIFATDKIDCPECRIAELEEERDAYAVANINANCTIAELKAQIKAFRTEIQDCRDAWAPDQPPSDLRQFLIDLESTLEGIS